VGIVIKEAVHVILADALGGDVEERAGVVWGKGCCVIGWSWVPPLGLHVIYGLIGDVWRVDE